MNLTFLVFCNLCLVNLLCAQEQEGKQFSDSSRYRPIVGQESDMRYFYSSHSNLQQRIVNKKCFIDVRGRIYSNQSSIVQSQLIDWRDGLTVESVLQQLHIDLKNLSGSQVRIFKRNEIIQSSRFYKTRTKEEEARIKMTLLEPGDVVLFTVVE